jgi:polyisoprenoid-binding protein YceI
MSRSALAIAPAFVIPLSAAAADQPVPLGPGAVPAGHYVIDPRHTTVTARVMHEGVSLYVLRFDRMDGSFDFDPAHPEATHLTASVDPASLDVNGDWAKEFSDKFLKAGQFPQASFVSTAVQSLGGPQGTVSGNLTLMGVTRPVTFNVTLTGSAHESLPPPFGVRAAGFEAVTTIKRSDFGSTYVQGQVGDDVTLTIDAEFDKK